MTRSRLAPWALVFIVACTRSGSSLRDASADGGVDGSSDGTLIRRAEDTRRAKDIPPEVRTSHDVTARRQSARALSRIADAQSVGGLVDHLADDDPETVAWAAYGLGYAWYARDVRAVLEARKPKGRRRLRELRKLATATKAA